MWILGMGLTPDGRRLLCRVAHEKRLRVVDVATGAELPTFGDFDMQGSRIAVTPDGGRVIVPCWDHIELWDLKRGELRSTLRPDGETGLHVAVPSPDGKWLITGSYDGDVRAFDRRRKREVSRWNAGASVNDLAISPNSAHVLVAAKGQALWALGLPDLRRIAKLDGDADFYSCAAASPSTAVAGDVHGGVHFLDLLA
jgi:WD40 repeat protein